MMGRYISWENDCVPRYSRLADLGSGGAVDSAWVAYSENFIDSQLAGYFTTPFSSNNLTVKDLCIDQTYCMTLKFRDKETAELVCGGVMDRLEALKNGDESMVTDSGDIINTDGSGTLYSTTENYHSVFDIGDDRFWTTDSSQIEAIEDAKGF